MGAVVAGIFVTAFVSTVVALFRSLSPPKTPTPATQSFTVETLEQLSKEAKEKLGMDMKLFNFAVAGQSRTGQ